jgi:hypothetical protein
VLQQCLDMLLDCVLVMDTITTHDVVLLTQQYSLFSFTLCPHSPGDVSAMTPGGIRMGTPALTSRYDNYTLPRYVPS